MVLDRLPKISLCMIARNEEDWIGQAIESVKPIIYEAIVVDTGSEDRTPEIAQGLGAKIIHEPWKDDFALHRNTSLRDASGDWILVLDADEAIAEEDLHKFVELTRDRTRCIEFLQRHYSHDHRLSEYVPVRGEYPKWENGQPGYFESNCVRLFPNREGIEFRGRVHELAEHSIRELGRFSIVRTDVRIHHFGHTRKVRVKKDKGKIYSPLGEQKIKEDPKNWQAFFELGVEHNVNGRHEKSVLAFNQAIEMNPTYIPAWVNRGYVNCELGRYQDAIADLKQALRLDPGSFEAYCNLGVVGMRTQDFRLAEESFVRAINLNPVYVNAMINLGKTYALTGRLSEGVLLYKRALDVLPACTPAKLDLGAIYLQGEMYQEAEHFLVQAAKEDPDLSRTFFNLGQLYQVTKRPKEAIEALERFCELEGDEDGGSAELLSKVRSEIQELKEVKGV